MALGYRARKRLFDANQVHDAQSPGLGAGARLVAFHAAPRARSQAGRAPYTFVTTVQFLVAFELESLQDLPDREQLKDAGLAEG